MQISNSSDNPSAPCPALFGVPIPGRQSSKSILRDTLQSSQWTAGMVRHLADLVGGIDQLERIDTIPLPDHPFDWTLVSATDHATVADVLGEIGSHADGILDDEYRTIVHRLLERIAMRDPKSLHRGSAIRTAAALTWLALHGNGHLSRCRWETAEYIWTKFRVSSCADRGRSLFASAGLTPPMRRERDQFLSTSDVWLCDVQLLHSDTRVGLLKRREQTIRVIEDVMERAADAHPFKPLDGGRYRVNARPVTPRWAIRAQSDSGRALVVATFGEDEDRPEVLALSIPDARLLVSLLERAIDPPTSHHRLN